MQIVKNILICIAISFVCLFGLIMFQNLCAELFIMWGLEDRITVDLFQNGFWIAFILIGILPPIYEELIFRLGVCKLLKWSGLKNLYVIIISAVIFMLYHGSWSQTVYQLIMGIFFAWIFIKTNNIFWSMLIHFINNAFIITYTYIAGVGSDVFELTGVNVTLAIVLAIVSVYIVSLLIRKGISNAKRV